MLAICAVLGGTAVATAQAPPGRDARPGVPSAPAPEPPIRLPEVLVEGRVEQPYNAATSTTGTKIDVPIFDLPQSIEIIPRQVIDDQRALTLTDVFRNVSGFSPSINSQSQRFGDRNAIFRGFMVNNYYTNGYKDAFNGSAFSFSLANVDRVEVLKGPASVLYGLGDPGATINVITKQPLAAWYAAGEVTAGSYGFVEPSVDVSGPLTPDSALRFRFNAAYQRQDSFVDFVESERYLLAPVVAYTIGPQTQVTLEGEYQALQELYYTGLPAAGTILPNVNGELPRSRYLGDPELEGDHFPERTLGKVGYRLEHRFNDRLSLRQGFRVSLQNRNERDVLPFELQADQRTFDRDLFVATGWRNDYYLLTELVADFAVGPVEHRLLVGTDQRFLDTHDASATAVLPPIDAFAPTYGGLRDPIGPGTPRRVSEQTGRFIGLYLQDFVTIVERVKLLVGGRYDWARQDTTSRLSGAVTDSEFDDGVFTPRVGLVYQPIPTVSLYASYSTSFNPLPGTTFDGTAFEPEQGEQWEGGVKLDLLSGRLASTIAAYDLTKENVLTPDPQHPEFSIQLGEQESHGVEVDVAGEVWPGFQLIAAYAFTDATITESDFGTQGNAPANVPRHTGSIWGVYRFASGALHGVGFGIGLVGVGERPADDFDSATLPAYVRPDAAIFLRRWKHVDLALNFKNFADVRYFETSTFGTAENGISPGTPFSVFGTLTVRY